MVDVYKNFVRAEFIDKVKVHPKYLDKNIKANVLNVLKKTKEAVCTNHGYIKKNSIEIVELDNGNIDVSSFHGYIIFRVRYEALVCNPVKDNIVTARVVNVNNFGILCHSSMIEDGEEIPILEIIVPKHSLSIKSEIDLCDTNITPGKEVMIKIVGKKYQLNNKKISIIGIIVNTNATDVRLEKETDGGGEGSKGFDDFDLDEEDITSEDDEDDADFEENYTESDEHDILDDEDDDIMDDQDIDVADINLSDISDQEVQSDDE